MLLRWSRYDLQRHTALPFVVIDWVLIGAGRFEGTLADEIIIEHALHRAGIELTADGGARLNPSAG